MWNLCKLIDDDKNWDLKIETVLLGYRSSCQETTKQSPYYIIFQKQMRLPIDSEMIPSQNLCSSSSENELPDIIQALLESRETSFAKTSLNISSFQNEIKKLYDRKHQTN